ncbi:MAG: ABC transporter permease [Burkholderiales bacterium]
MSSGGLGAIAPRKLLLAVLPLFLVLQALWRPIGVVGGNLLDWSGAPLPFAIAAVLACLLGLWPTHRRFAVAVYVALAGLAAVAPLMLLTQHAMGSAAAATDTAPPDWDAGLWLYLCGLALLAGGSVRRVAELDLKGPLGEQSTAIVFGIWILVFWQLLIEAFNVPRVLLPSPLQIWQALLANRGTLSVDFMQTVLHAVLIGYAIGCGFGFAVGVLIDRSPFLQRGLLPLSALASAVPLVGIAPIAVMWFGFDWHSKAAVVALMTFFPMLVNTLAGLKSAGHMELDLMRSYGASYWRTLLSLRIPVALPFVFNALKVNSALALIGAIVAEFFGSPISGLGFRISTEAARLNMPVVWAAILVSSVTGSVFFALLAIMERRATFWHPSLRKG